MTTCDFVAEATLRGQRGKTRVIHRRGRFEYAFRVKRLIKASGQTTPAIISELDKSLLLVLCVISDKNLRHNKLVIEGQSLDDP